MVVLQEHKLDIPLYIPKNRFNFGVINMNMTFMKNVNNLYSLNYFPLFSINKCSKVLNYFIKINKFFTIKI